MRRVSPSFLNDFISRKVERMTFLTTSFFSLFEHVVET